MQTIYIFFIQPRYVCQVKFIQLNVEQISVLN